MFTNISKNKYLYKDDTLFKEATNVVEAISGKTDDFLDVVSIRLLEDIYSRILAREFVKSNIKDLNKYKHVSIHSTMLDKSFVSTVGLYEDEENGTKFYIDGKIKL